MSEDGSSEPQASPPSAPGGTSGPPLPPPRIPDHELLSRIGRGAYGEVWLARSITGAYRAVKVVRRSSFDHDRPFEREFEGILKFEPISRTHESQVDILHVGRGEDYFYYVMELADDQVTGGQILPDNYHARTVKSDLVFRNRLPFEECVSVGIALATALEHLHRNGLVHRDVKPSNIIFVNGVAKLADIGLVTGVDTTRSYVGTEGFAAPEGPGTPQADLFSLGKVLYEMSTGKDRQQFPELPTNLRELPDREGIAELNAVIARACRHDPRDRYATAAAMRADLELLQSGKSLARLHRLEARLRAATRVGAVVSLLTVLAVAAWVYQARQTRIVREISERSQRAEKQSRNALASLQAANGTKFMSQSVRQKPARNRLAHALAWFAQALANVQGDPVRERSHRMRIAALLDRHPKLIHHFVHPEPVARSAFTPDGTKLVTHSGRDEIRVYDLVTGQLKYSISEGRNSAGRPSSATYSPGLGFSPDGRRLIVRACWLGEETHIYNLDDGRLIRPPQLNSGNQVRILDCIDGKTALVQDSKMTARLFDLDTEEAVSIPFEVSGEIFSGRLTSNGKHLALLYEDSEGAWVESALLQIRQSDSGTALGPALKMEKKGRYLLSADGSRIVFSPEVQAPARLLNTTTGEETATFDGILQAFVIHPDMQWLVLKRTIEEHGRALFNVDTGETLNLEYSEDIRDVCLSADGLLLATASDDGTARLWNRSTGEELADLNHATWCYGVGFSPDGERLATSSDDRAVRVWDLASISVPRLTLRQQGEVFDAAFSPDGEKIITVSDDLLGLRIWDSRSGRPLAPPIAPTPDPSKIRFSPDGHKFITTPLRRGIWSELGAWLYRTDPTTISEPIGLDTNRYVEFVEFDLASRRVLTGGAGNIRIWDASTGNLLLSGLETNAPVSRACFLSNNNHIAAASGNSIQIWDATSGKLLRELLQEDGNLKFKIQSLAISPDGIYLAAGGSDQSLHIWNLDTGKPMSAPLWLGGTPVLATFSQDSKFILSHGNTERVRVWKVGDAETFLPPLVHERGGIGAEFSPDGQFIGTKSPDGNARLWDFASGDLIDKYPHGDMATVARFHPRTGELLTAGTDSRVCVWKPRTCEYSVEQVVRLAEVLSSRKVDAQGSDLPIPPEKTAAEFQLLLQALPDAFRTTPAQKAYWHEYMAGLARASKLWNSVVFHVSRSLEIQPSVLEGPTGDELLMVRGDALGELGRFSEAEVDFERAIRLDPSNFYRWFEWGTAALAQNRTNTYKEFCQEAFRRFTSSSGSQVTRLLQNRALAMWACYPGLTDYSRPLHFIQELIEERGDVPNDLTIRGKLRYRLGQLGEAIADLERGDQEDPETFLFLAMAHHRLGRPEKALEQFQRGVQASEKLEKSGSLLWYLKVYNEVELSEAKAVLGVQALNPVQSKNPPRSPIEAP